MQNRFKNITTLFLLAMLLPSCAKVDTAQVPTIEGGTLVGSDEISSIYDSRKEKFNNALSIEIQEAKFPPGCYEADRIIPLTFIFYNHSNSPLIVYAKLIQAFFSRRLGLTFYTLSSKIVDSSGALVAKSPSLPGIVMDRTAKRDDFMEIPPNGKYGLNLEYYFPELKKGSANSETKEFSIFVTYHNAEFVGPSVNDDSITPQYDWNVWMGSVEAPALTVCIKDP